MDKSEKTNKPVVIILLILGLLIWTRETYEQVYAILWIVNCVAGVIALGNLGGVNEPTQKNLDYLFNAVLIMTLTGLMAGVCEGTLM